uniref:Uncharacterized protein n=1 Tax=Candidatus Kentrum sp. UNK TaxID=2126344 RepID=A0A451A427_9GAMM|nr:MAG: hypothetical protein BECKUNK1418G_GA0071005_101317 [Candidatus Kentron sp. UNK]VFK69462.1 MAG: hypothetical protein BECKUNK1418H_GA0071006_101417 [Candidatus Kentron sp. UNK]
MPSSSRCEKTRWFFSLLFGCLAFLTAELAESRESQKFSPALFAHVPSADREIKRFVECHKSTAGRVLASVTFELGWQVFGRKTGDLSVILPSWFGGFLEPEYSVAFKTLISGGEVSNIRSLYNQVMAQARAAPKISKLLYTMEKNGQGAVGCPISYSTMHRRVNEQHDIAEAWLDLIFLYIDINNDYRAFMERRDQFEKRYKRYLRTKDKLHKIENY